MKIIHKVIIILFILSCISLHYVVAQKGSNERFISRLSFQSFMEPGPILEAGVSVGAANALTDIAFNSYNASKYSIAAINKQGMSPAASAFVRYRFNEATAFKTSISAMKLRGNDSWASDDSIANRGKYYSNNVYELALLGEIYLPQNILNPTNAFRLNYVDLFIFGGLSGFYHSPSLGGPIIDEYDLVLQMDPDAYNNWQIAIPFGVGFKWSFAQSWTAGMDFMMRYTFLDHLDGFSRPVSYGNDLFFTTKFSIGFILDDRRRHANRVGSRYVARPFKPKVRRTHYL